MGFFLNASNNSLWQANEHRPGRVGSLAINLSLESYLYQLVLQMCPYGLSAVLHMCRYGLSVGITVCFYGLSAGIADVPPWSQRWYYKWAPMLPWHLCEF